MYEKRGYNRLVRGFDHIRRGLREGKYMRRIALCCALSAACLYLFLPFESIKIVFALSSVITAAISSVVFSLRDKAVQYGLGLIAESKEPALRQRQVKECALKLTSMLILGVVCSLMCVIASYLQPDCRESIAEIGSLKYYNALCCFFFAYCYVKYFYLIFAFEDLEFIRIDHAVKMRRKSLEDVARRRETEECEKFPDDI